MTLDAVADVVRRMRDLGCDEIDIADTIGVSTPRKTQTVMETAAREFHLDRIAGHFHDTYGQALANIYASLEVGVSIFHSSVSGLGGCPYAKGATGNVATEDVIYMLNGLGIETGVDLDKVVDAGLFITGHLGRKGVSRADRTDYNSPINVRSSGWCSDWPSGGSWFPAQWAGELVGLEGMPNPANFKVKEMDAEQNRILDELSPEDAVEAWGEFDQKMEEEYYPAVVTGYGGVAMIHGSKVGGMANDNVRGMPTFQRMYITK